MVPHRARAVARPAITNELIVNLNDQEHSPERAGLWSAANAVIQHSC